SFVFGAARSLSGQVDGGGGSNTLDYSAYKTAISANLQTGAITGAKSFQNFANLRGGAGSDKLIAADLANTWNIASPNAGTVGTLSFQSFENLSGGNFDDTFVIADGASVKGKIDGRGGNDL